MEFPILAANPDAGVPAVALILASVLSFAAIYFFKRWRKISQTHQLMLDTKPSPITAISEGPCEFLGKIGNVAPPLVSPWSQQACVYYDFDVDEYQSSGDTWGYCSVFNDQQIQRFTVTDTSGSVEINPSKRLLEVKIDHQDHARRLNEASPELQMLLKHRYDNPLSPKKYRIFGYRGDGELRFTEKVLAVGDPVYVFGEAKREGGKLVISDGVMPLIISEEGQQHAEKMYYLPSTIVYVVGMIVASLGAMFFFILLGAMLSAR